MLDGVLVAIDAQGAPTPALAQSAVESCESALGKGRCILAPEGDDAAAPWHASVEREPGENSNHLVIEVERNGEPYRTRQLEFTDLDAPALRWKAAGVVIAAIVAGRMPEPERPAPEAEPPPPEPSPPRPPPLPPPPVVTSTPLRSSITVGPLLGPALNDGRWQFGATLIGKSALRGSNSYVAAALSGAAVPSNLLVVGGDVALGVGARVFHSPSLVSLDVALYGVGQWLWVRLKDRGEVDSGYKFRAGSTLAVSSAWPTIGCWATVVGGRIGWMRPDVTIRHRGVSVSLVPSLSAMGLLALQYQLQCDRE